MKRKSIGVGLALMALIGVGITYTQAQAGQKSHKVNLCHGTASHSNPYVLIKVDRSALQGHFDGTAPGHGKNNYPDFISHDGTCRVQPDTDGGSS